jgi:hypothetical protein
MKKMTQYRNQVQEHKEKTAAEIWGKKVSSMHSFNSDDTNMWYDRPQENGKRDGRVMDIAYNSGLIVREIRSTGETIHIGSKDTGKSLLDRYRRWRAG